MRTRDSEKKPLPPLAQVWHSYNGISEKEFANRAGITEREVGELINRNWFDRKGNRPELWSMAPGRYPTRWSFSPGSVERYAAEAGLRHVMESRARSKMKWEAGIYVVRTEEGPRRYKIGYASRMEKRLSGLRGSSPVQLTLVAFIPGKGMSAEYRLHRVFRRNRRHGEWFDESPALLRLIEKHAYRGPQP